MDTLTERMKTKFCPVVSQEEDAVDVDVQRSAESLDANTCEDVYSTLPRMYMVEVVARTREHPRVRVGSSPRGSQALLNTSRQQLL